MRLLAPPLVPHYRLARLVTWARLWLARVAGLAAHFAPLQFERAARARLDQCAQLLARVIFLRAFARLGAPPSNRPFYLPTRHVGLRALLGSALRRALRGKDARAKLAALAAFVQNAELHIAKLAARLARAWKARLTIALAPVSAPPALCAACTEAPSADTS